MRFARLFAGNRSEGVDEKVRSWDDQGLAGLRRWFEPEKGIQPLTYTEKACAKDQEPMGFDQIKHRSRESDQRKGPDAARIVGSSRL
jgi:hypothetical protein